MGSLQESRPQEIIFDAMHLSFKVYGRVFVIDYLIYLFPIEFVCNYLPGEH